MKNFVRASTTLFMTIVFSFLVSCAEDESAQQQPTGGNSSDSSAVIACENQNKVWDYTNKKCGVCKERFVPNASGACTEDPTFALARTTCKGRQAYFNESDGSCTETPDSCLNKGQALRPNASGSAGTTCTDLMTAQQFCASLGTGTTTPMVYDRAQGTCTSSTSTTGTVTTTDCQTRGGTPQTNGMCLENATSCSRKLAVNGISWVQDPTNQYNCVLSNQVQNNNSSGMWGAISTGLQNLPGVINAIKN